MRPNEYNEGSELLADFSPDELDQFVTTLAWYLQCAADQIIVRPGSTHSPQTIWARGEYVALCRPDVIVLREDHYLERAADKEDVAVAVKAAMAPAVPADLELMDDEIFGTIETRRGGRGFVLTDALTGKRHVVHKTTLEVYGDPSDLVGQQFVGRMGENNDVIVEVFTLDEAGGGVAGNSKIEVRMREDITRN